MEYVFIYLVGAYILGVLLQNEAMSNHFVLKSRWDEATFVIFLSLSWVGVLVLVLTWNVEPKSYTKWNPLALWPGNWFATDRYITLNRIDVITIAWVIFYTCVIHMPSMWATLVGITAVGFTRLLCKDKDEYQIHQHLIVKIAIIVGFGTLLLTFCPIEATGQSVYRTYYSDPAHIQCARVTIANDTTLEASCFDEDCFNELATVYSPWCGPYAQVPYGPVSPTFRLLAKYTPVNTMVYPWDLNDPILWEIASLPPIETVIKDVPVMLETSQMPKIRVYLGDGPIYSFVPNSTEFSTDSRPGTFQHLKGLTPQDIMSCLLDHLSITAVIQPKSQVEWKLNLLM